MAYIFLDESGDLGFDFRKKRTTKYFVVTFLFADEKRPIEKVVREIHRGLRKKYKMRAGVLHAFKEEPVTCTRFCRKLATKKCKIMTIYLNKSKVYTKLQDEKQILYNYITNILLDRIMTKRLVNKEERIELTASRRETNKFFNLNFQNYLKQQARNNHKLDIEIKIKTPSEEKGLQAVDMASWAIFRKYEYGRANYYDIIKPLIVEESPLYP
jgi:hypothetical protein